MSEVLSCPRCGGGVEEYFDDELKCLNKLCAAWWSTGAVYERECIARDLAGTRAVKTTEDWLPQNKNDRSGLAEELESLVYLVRLETLREVDKGLTAAIKGRDTDAYTSHSPLKAQIERDVLLAMQKWIRELTSELGDKT